jgi:hypothetical protein
VPLPLAKAIQIKSFNNKRVENTHHLDEEMIIDVSTLRINFGEVIKVKNPLFLVTRLCFVTHLQWAAASPKIWRQNLL